MPANVLEWIAGGFKSAWYTKLDTDGFATGASGTVTAGATFSPGGRIKGARTAPIQLEAPPTVSVLGDNVVYGAFQFAPENVPNFTLELAVNNATFNSRAQSTATRNVGNASVEVIQPQNFSPTDLAMWFIRDAKSQQGSTIGKGLYETILLSKATAYPLGANMSQREAANFQAQITINPSAGTPMGYTLSNTVEQTEVASGLRWTSDYPLFLDATLGTGALTLFGPLTFTPVSTSLSDMYVYVEGIRQTSGVTISVANKTLTFSSPPASDSRIEVWYQNLGY